MRVMADRLGPYLADLHCAWLADDCDRSFKELDASLLFFDISGFTPLTERLAKRGKAGVEQLIDTLDGVVARSSPRPARSAASRCSTTARVRSITLGRRRP